RSRSAHPVLVDAGAVGVNYSDARDCEGEATMHKSGVIEYKHEDYECEGFAVWDAAGAKRPGILVFPEWVGVGEYTHKRAQMLGDLGFKAFVVDVYGKRI